MVKLLKENKSELIGMSVWTRRKILFTDPEEEEDVEEEEDLPEEVILQEDALQEDPQEEDTHQEDRIDLVHHIEEADLQDVLEVYHPERDLALALTAAHPREEHTREELVRWHGCCKTISIP